MQNTKKNLKNLHFFISSLANSSPSHCCFCSHSPCSCWRPQFSCCHSCPLFLHRLNAFAFAGSVPQWWSAWFRRSSQPRVADDGTGGCGREGEAVCDGRSWCPAGWSGIGSGVIGAAGSGRSAGENFYYFFLNLNFFNFCFYF